MEPRERSWPSRFHPFHSHTLHVVKDVGDPASVMDTRMVSTEPQLWHRMGFRVSGVMPDYFGTRPVQGP